LKKETYAQDAVNQFVQYSCVFILPGKPGAIAPEVGSGIIFVTPKKRHVILTAKHIAENAVRQIHRLGYYKCKAVIDDFIAGILLFPGDVDVALLLIKDNFSEPLENLAVSTDSVPYDNYEIQSADSLVLCGYPSELSHYSPQKSEQGFKLLTYWWSDKPVSEFDQKNRYRLEWGDAQHWRTDKSLDLPAPKGISGGPLWRFRKPDSDSLWSASEIGKIIGVQSAWDRRKTTIVEPAFKWSNWFQKSIEQIDSD